MVYIVFEKYQERIISNYIRMTIMRLNKNLNMTIGINLNMNPNNYSDINLSIKNCLLALIIKSKMCVDSKVTVYILIKR